MKYSWSFSPENESNDCRVVHHLLQLIPSMAMQVLLGVVHLLLAIEPKHAGHQHRCTCKIWKAVGLRFIGKLPKTL